MQGNLVHDKSFDFALKVVAIYKYLVYQKKESVLSRQLLRSGTSIGANVAESIGGQSRKDFLNKMQIAFKEAQETKYWLSLLNRSGYLEDPKAFDLLEDCESLCRIIGKIISSIKSNDN